MNAQDLVAAHVMLTLEARANALEAENAALRVEIDRLNKMVLQDRVVADAIPHLSKFAGTLKDDRDTEETIRHMRGEWERERDDLR